LQILLLLGIILRVPTFVKAPTIRQKKFAKILVATGSKQEAYKGAYNVGRRGGISTPQSINTMANNVMMSPAVKSLIQQELDNVGLTEGRVSKKLNAIIEGGTTVKKLKTVDPRLSFEALKEVSKLKGSYAPERIDKRTAKFNLNLEGKLKDKTEGELMDVLKGLAQEVKSFSNLVKQTNELHPLKE